MAFPSRKHRPPRWNLAQLRLLEAVGEEGVELRRQTAGPTLGLGSHGVEVDEPGVEEGLGHGFEGLADASVEFDFVVEGAEDAGDASLFVEGREVDR